MENGKNIWTKIDFPPSVSETAKQQENDGGASTNNDIASMKQSLSNIELDKSHKPTQKEEAADLEETKKNKKTENNGSLKEEKKTHNKQTLLSFYTKDENTDTPKLIQTQSKNLLIKYAREQIKLNNENKITYQFLIKNITTNHGIKSKYKDFKNISISTIKTKKYQEKMRW